MKSTAAAAVFLASFGFLVLPALASAPAPGPSAGMRRPARPATVPATPFPYPADAHRSTPGTFLHLIETGRKRTPGTVEVDYRMEGGGFPRGKVYRLVQLALADPAEHLCGAGRQVDAIGAGAAGLRGAAGGS